MHLPVLANQVLKLLAENAQNNASPKVMDSETIAGSLAMSLAETKQLLRAMDGLGMIMNDIDGQYSLITQKGLHWLTRIHSGSRPSM